MSQTLYICYFGIREPLVQTQVLPYLREIQKDRVKVFLLTFEPDLKQVWSTEQIEIEKDKLAKENITWYCLPYHKTPSVPATFYDILRGSLFIRSLVNREKIDILHARVHTPAMMGAIAKRLLRRKPKLLFDIRGFFPEEYTDGGVWKENGWLYRGVKKLEKWLMRESDGFVVLTEKAREILFPESVETGRDKLSRPIEVIPCCVDLKKFTAANTISRAEIRSAYALESRRVIVYTGSLGSWYLSKEMADFMGVLREHDKSTFALILTQSEPDIMTKELKKQGFTDSDYIVKKVAHDEIPRYLSGADIAISFIKPCFSKLSSSPTKIAEYLASGLPIVTNYGIGDVAEQIEQDNTGVVIDDFNNSSYRKAFHAVDKLRENPDLAENCRSSALKRFDLQKIGGAKYRTLYKKMGEFSRKELLP